jgi:chromosome segregation ATPase
MSAEHPTDTPASLDELDEFGRRVVAEAEALPRIEPKVELTEAETDQLLEVLVKACGRLRFHEEANPHLPAHSQAVEAALNDLIQRQATARRHAHQATLDRDRAFIDCAYRKRERAQQRDSQQGGGGRER